MGVGTAGMEKNETWGFPGGTGSKKPACQCRRCKRRGFNPWVRRIPWRRAWPRTPVFLSGKSHGQRSLAGYSPWGRKESDTSLGFSRQEYWSGLPCPPPRDLPDPGIEATSLVAPALQAGSLPLSHQQKPQEGCLGAQDGHSQTPWMLSVV